jgi:capsular polysaccharide biosynthesis protein
MNEEPLDLHRFGRAMARGKWTLAAFVVAGLLAGVVVSLVRPPWYSAGAVVLLPAAGLDVNGNPARDPQTEVQIASSTNVLQIAAQNLRPASTVNNLRARVKVAAPTADILHFTGRAPSAGAAIAIANAMADAYRQYATSNASQQTQQLVNDLKNRVTQLRAQISSLNGQIASATNRLGSLSPNSREASLQTALIESLRAQQGDATVQLNADLNQITQSQVSTDSNGTGIQVISHAASASNSAVRTIGGNLALGAGIGFLLGTAVVIARDRRDRRLRRRADIAAAAGAPAVASIATQAPRKASDWVALLQNYEPTTDESWSLRRILRALVASETPPTQLNVVTLSDDAAAVAVAPQLASYAAASGVRTVLVVNGRDPSLATLRQVRDDAQTGAQLRANLTITGAEPDQHDEGARAQLIVNMLAFDDRMHGDEPARGSTSLLAVTAGAATPERIAAASAAMADADRPFAGIVVANPESDDTSDGEFAHRSHASRSSDDAGDAKHGSAS